MTNNSNAVRGTIDDGIDFHVHSDEIEIPFPGTSIYWPEVPLSDIQRLIKEVNSNVTLKMRLLNIYPDSIYDRLSEYVLSGNGHLDRRYNTVSGAKVTVHGHKTQAKCLHLI